MKRIYGIVLSAILLLLHQEAALCFTLHAVKDCRATDIRCNRLSSWVRNVHRGSHFPMPISDVSAKSSTLQMRLWDGKVQGGLKEKKWTYDVSSSIQNWIRARGILGRNKRADHSESRGGILKTLDEIRQIRRTSTQSRMEAWTKFLPCKRVRLRSVIPLMLTLLLTISSVPERAHAMAVGGGSAPLQPLTRLVRLNHFRFGFSFEFIHFYWSYLLHLLNSSHFPWFSLGRRCYRPSQCGLVYSRSLRCFTQQKSVSQPCGLGKSKNSPKRRQNREALAAHSKFSMKILLEC